MGQKVHPYGFRLGYTKGWRSRWFADAGYADLVAEDIKLKTELKNKLRPAGISSIELDRPGNKLRIQIRTARPGIIIGRRGSEIEKLKADLQAKTNREVYIDIQEVHRPELDAQLVAESVAMQIEKRVAFRRAMRKAVDSALRFGCKGIKIRVSGRLNGAEIARTEWYLQGRLPLQTLRADIEYGFTEARTTYGVIGVKCWVFRGDILDAKRDDLDQPRRRAGVGRRPRRDEQEQQPRVEAGQQQAAAQQFPPQQAPQQAPPAQGQPVQGQQPAQSPPAQAQQPTQGQPPPAQFPPQQVQPEPVQPPAAEGEKKDSDESGSSGQ